MILSTFSHPPSAVTLARKARRSSIKAVRVVCSGCVALASHNGFEPPKIALKTPTPPDDTVHSTHQGGASQESYALRVWCMRMRMCIPPHPPVCMRDGATVCVVCYLLVLFFRTRDAASYRHRRGNQRCAHKRPRTNPATVDIRAVRQQLKQHHTPGVRSITYVR